MVKKTKYGMVWVKGKLKVQSTEIEPGDVKSLVSSYENTNQTSVKVEVIYDIA